MFGIPPVVLKRGARFIGAAALAIAGLVAWAVADGMSWQHGAACEMSIGLLLALYGLARGWHDRRWRKREDSWVQVVATITKSDTTKAYPWGGGNQDFWRQDVAYTYALEGQDFVGHRVQMDEASSTSRSEAQSWNDEYPVGAAVTAYCNPRNPKQCVLERDDDGKVLLVYALLCMPIFGAVACVFLLAGVLHG